MKAWPIIFALCLTPNVWAQETRKELKGKVVSDVPDFEGVNVVNLNSGQSVQTNPGGYFSISAKPGDTLMFSSVMFKARQILIRAEDFDGKLLLVNLESLIPLDAVSVARYRNINAKALGIIPQNQKSYTPAERKLKTAGDLKPIDFLGLLGGQMPLDPIWNAVSGRTAMLKKEIGIERKEMLLKKIEDRFEDRYFTERLKIPPDYVSGFKYFILENDSFTAALNAKEFTNAEWILAGLAAKYKDTISSEKK